MKRFNKVLFLLLIISLPLILLHCTKYKEEVPFFDGLVLEYDWGGGIREIYNVQVLDNFRFKIIETKKREPLSDKIKELFVDKYGMVYKSSFKAYEGAFSPIWIPVHEMEIGDTIFDGSYTAIRKEGLRVRVWVNLRLPLWKSRVGSIPRGIKGDFYNYNLFHISFRTAS